MEGSPEYLYEDVYCQRGEMENHLVCSRISKVLIANSENILTRALVYPVPESESLFVAICDSIVQWWGRVCFLEYVDGQIVWQADCNEWIVEQSVYRVRAISNPNGDGHLIEVFGMTHMGNGSYYLFELVGRSFKNVLKAWAVDVHTGDWKTIRKDILAPEFEDVDGDGYLDVVLTGVIDEGISYDDKVSPFSVSYK